MKNYQPLPSYERSRISRNLKQLRQFEALRQERPYGHKSRVKRSDYGSLSETSRYRQITTSTRSLTTSRLNGCELLSYQFDEFLSVETRRDRDPGRQLKYSPVIINGRIVS
jgi:hypothetical protein